MPIFQRCLFLASLLGGVVLHADVIVFIQESADEMVSQLKIGSVQICGFKGTPGCGIPITIDTRDFPSKLDGTYTIKGGSGEPASDSFTIQKGFPGRPDFHGMTGFSSDAANDNSPAETDTQTFDTNPKIVVTISSLCEPPGGGKQPDMIVCSSPVPEPSLGFPLAVCLAVLGAYAWSRDKPEKKRTCFSA